MIDEGSPQIISSFQCQHYILHYVFYINVHGHVTVNAPVVDLTDDDGKPSSPTMADSREVTFNKLSGKTFPSLVVVARPNLRIKDMAQGTVSQERAALGEFS